MLVTAQEVKAAWPTWETYCAAGIQGAETAGDVLARTIEQAETDFSEYVSVGADDITGPLKRHLIKIAKKLGFDYLHGETVFQFPPQIVRDYAATLKTLERYRSGDLDIEQPHGAASVTDEAEKPAHVTMSAKPRRFARGWFTDPDA